jgi:PAS domain S-box-containing protein
VTDYDQTKTKEQLIAELEAARQRLVDLALAEERNYNLFEHTGDSIFVVDPSTFAIVDANANAARRLMYSPDELRRLTLDDIEVIDPTFPGSVAWESNISGTRVYDCFYRRKDGFLLPVEVSSRLVTEGQRTVLQNAVRDIARRKQAEAALQEAHNRLLILQQIDTEISRRLDVRYVLSVALDVAVRLSGADAGLIAVAEGEEMRVVEALGEYPAPVGVVLPRDHGIIARAVRLRAPELVLSVADDPDYVPLIPTTRAQMVLPLIAQGQLVGALSLETRQPQRFVTGAFEFIKLLAVRMAIALDNAHAYEELARLVEDLDAFAHTVAHDLKNPLNSILGYASFLSTAFDDLPPDQRQNFVAAILRGGHKIVNIIDELLLLASVRKLKTVDPRPLRMAQIVDEALTRLRVLIDERHPVISAPDDWPVALGYAPWVEEVWANYISNAIKYGGDPPHLRLGATVEADGMARFWVRDNGPGITPDDQARLFDQFTRLDETRAEGHGLGLSIVRRIVDKLGGQVGVESQPGAGSEFYFTLPVG